MDLAETRSSRHQEWDMMYRAGLSPRRIAELCGAPRSTVQLHLKTQSDRDPTLARDHDRNLKPKAVPGPAWLARAEELARFSAENDRMPMGTIDPSAQGAAERVLGQWVSRQRSLDRDGKLTPGQLAVLNRIPGWRSTGRAARDASRWQEKLAGTAAYLSEHGRWPSYKHYKSEHERSLGVWLHAQRQGNWQQTLQEDKREALDEKLPGWSSDLRRRGKPTREMSALRHLHGSRETPPALV